MRRISNFLLSLFLVANLATACSTQRTVTRDVEYDRAGEPVTVERQTTTTENSSTEDTGVVSGTFNAIGEVIARIRPPTARNGSAITLPIAVNVPLTTPVSSVSELSGVVVLFCTVTGFFS